MKIRVDMYPLTGKQNRVDSFNCPQGIHINRKHERHRNKSPQGIHGIGTACYIEAIHFQRNVVLKIQTVTGYLFFIT
jgi:hypothetical protein